MNALVVEHVFVHLLLEDSLINDLLDYSLIESDLPHDLHDVDLSFIVLQTLLKQLVHVSLPEAAEPLALKFLLPFLRLGKDRIEEHLERAELCIVELVVCHSIIKLTMDRLVQL